MVIYNDLRNSWPLSYQIYNHIFSECGSPLSGHLTHVHHFLWVVSIYMEDGSINHSPYICGVRRGPRKSRISGESNLQIYSYMYFTTSMSMIRLKVKNFQTIFFFNTLLWHKAKKIKPKNNVISVIKSIQFQQIPCILQDRILCESWKLTCTGKSDLQEAFILMSCISCKITQKLRFLHMKSDIKYVVTAQ